MSKGKKKPGKARRCWCRALMAVLVVLCVWLGHPPLFAWLLRTGVEAVCHAHGLTFEAETFHARLGGPVLMEGVRIRAVGRPVSMTQVDVASVECHWAGLGSLFSDGGRLVRKISCTGVFCLLDARTPARAGGGSEKRAPFDSRRWQRWFPLAASVQDSSLEVVGDNNQWIVRDMRAAFSEEETGYLKIGAASVQVGKFSKSFESLQALTAWKNGTLWIAGMDLLPGIKVQNFSLDLLSSDVPSASVMAEIFGGSLRADVTFGTASGSPWWDIAAWASNVSLEPVPSLLGLEGRIAGRLEEGRFTFRGRIDRPADAEASLRLVARGFRWNERGWESLEVGASLIHRRLVVTNFDLRQRENWVNFSGEVSLAEGWSQLARSSFLWNVRADIQELGALDDLFGGPLEGAAGRMSAAGSVSGRAGQLDGFFNIEASGMSFRSRSVDSLNLEAVFRKNEIEVVRCEAHAGKDNVRAQGRIDLAAPHQYSAALDAHIADVASYLAPFGVPGADAVYGGSTLIHWRGDGSLKAHSGAFDLKLNGFVSKATPTGITGKFTGTYSPQNLYFSVLEIQNGPLRLHSQAVLAASGIALRDLVLRSGNSAILEGEAFVPVNAFAAGANWRDAIPAEQKIYLRVASAKDVNIQDLAHLTGQEFPLRGAVRANLELTNTLVAPQATGKIEWKNAGWNPSPRMPSLEKTGAVILLAGSQARIERFRGEVGSGSFEITGGVNFANSNDLKYDIRLCGKELPMPGGADRKIRANLDVTAVGANKAGSIRGGIRLVDGRICRRFEATPLLALVPDDGFFAPPSAPADIPNPFALWDLDVKIENETKFLFQDDVTGGEIIPSVRLTGTLGHPIPIGRITLKDVKAFLPSAILTIPDGRVDFFSDNPWVPVLDVQGVANTSSGGVHAHAFGPINQRKLILRSDPPLPRESLVLLLTTGSAPSATPGTIPEEAAAGGIPPGEPGVSYTWRLR